jgi:hypothetical protein
MKFFGCKKHPRIRYIYAVTGGYYLGELLVYIETTDTNFCFLSLPDMIVRSIPIEKFNFGIDNKIVDIVEKIPAHVYKVCKQQYMKNKMQIAS